MYVQDQLAKIPAQGYGGGAEKIKSHHLLRRSCNQWLPEESISFLDGCNLPIDYPTPMHTKWTLGFNKDHIKWKGLGLWGRGEEGKGGQT